MDFDIEKLFPNSFLKDYQFKEDEYPDKDGLPMCKKCNTKRYFIVDFDGEKKAHYSRCKCQEEAYQKRQEEEKRAENLRKFRDRQKMSELGKKYLEASFETATITDHNREAYKKCVNYAKNSREVYNQNIGLYIYGDNSSGKSYLMACLCNELVAQGYNCLYTSVPSILAEIQSSYTDDTAMSQARVVTMIASKSFVFIDDLGKEFLGRENNAGAAKFAEKVLLEVLNARYNNGRPTIFSSNYSISELAEAFALDKAIIERINEMATRVIRLEGDNFRDKALKEKSEAAKKLGI